MAAKQWIGNYYVGEDGAMLVDTITSDGYRVEFETAKDKVHIMRKVK